MGPFAIILSAILAAAGTCLTLAFAGHPVAAILVGPCAGSLGALLVVGSSASFRLRPNRSVRQTSVVADAVGAGLRDLYAGMLTEPLPDRLATLAARI